MTIHPKFTQTIILGYWGIRGHVHQIRILLSYVGVPFEDKTYDTKESWFDKDKKTLGLPFPNIPYIIEGSFKLTESTAIHRYVASKKK